MIPLVSFTLSTNQVWPLIADRLTSNIFQLDHNPTMNTNPPAESKSLPQGTSMEVDGPGEGPGTAAASSAPPTPQTPQSSAGQTKTPAKIPRFEAPLSEEEKAAKRSKNAFPIPTNKEIATLTLKSFKAPNAKPGATENEKAKELILSLRQTVEARFEYSTNPKSIVFALLLNARLLAAQAQNQVLLATAKKLSDKLVEGSLEIPNSIKLARDECQSRLSAPYIEPLEHHSALQTLRDLKQNELSFHEYLSKFKEVMLKLDQPLEAERSSEITSSFTNNLSSPTVRQAIFVEEHKWQASGQPTDIPPLERAIAVAKLWAAAAAASGQPS